MLLHFSILKSVVYIPTVAKTEAGFYEDIEPVAVIELSDIDSLRSALKQRLFEGNQIIPTPKLTARATSVMMKYSPIKSLSKFDKEAAYWHIYEKGGVYEFGPLKKRADRGWEEDPEKMLKMPKESSLDDVVDHVVKSVQASLKRSNGQ